MKSNTSKSNKPMTNYNENTEELRDIAVLFANRIGSPWGEGATYSHSQAEPQDEDDKPEENGKLYSHFDDPDFDLFVTDFVEAIQAYSDQAVQAFGEKVLKEAKWLAYDDSEGEAIDAVPVSVITSLLKGGAE